jgi:hypothetical protein
MPVKRTADSKNQFLCDRATHERQRNGALYYRQNLICIGLVYGIGVDKNWSAIR